MGPRGRLYAAERREGGLCRHEISRRAPAYRVPARTAEVEVEARRSRFRCRLERVPDEDAARAVVEAARRRHWDAGHHCSAFVLGADGATARSSDDGEPAGSAGAPMLETLRGREVSDVVAVVSRWFGGTLLGVGGLVRAYSEAVALALDEAGVLRRERREVVEVDAAHAEAGRLEHELRARGRGRARGVVRRGGDADARRTGRAVGVAARHAGRADRGRGARRATSARTGSTCRRVTAERRRQRSAGLLAARREHRGLAGQLVLRHEADRAGHAVGAVVAVAAGVLVEVLLVVVLGVVELAGLLRGAQLGGDLAEAVAVQRRPGTRRGWPAPPAPARGWSSRSPSGTGVPTSLPWRKPWVGSWFSQNAASRVSAEVTAGS